MKKAMKSGVRARRRAGDAQPEVAHELVEELERVLRPTRQEVASAGHEDRRDEHDHHHDPHREDRGADARRERRAGRREHADR